MWVRAVGIVTACAILGACGSSGKSSVARSTATTAAKAASEAMTRPALCEELLALHRRDSRELDTRPSVAAEMWTTYLVQRVPLIRDKVLRAFAYDYAWTSWATDKGSALVAHGLTGLTAMSKDPEFAPEASKRNAMSSYYAHQLCYGEDAALVEG